MPAPSRRLELFAPEGFPEFQPGDDLAQSIVKTFDHTGVPLQNGDILVIAQKIVSKSEGRVRKLSDVSPSDAAVRLAAESEKDPRLIELILQESTEIVRMRPGLIIARHRNGCVVANAAIDLSNSGADETAVLLPVDADESAKNIATGIKLATENGANVAVIVNDSMGRAWRNGTTGTAIGCYGIASLYDRRGQRDRLGNVLQSSEIALADEIAAAGSLLMGQGDESLPVVVLRGLDWADRAGKSSDLVRAPDQDLFT
ncbi:MAG: coenzyme F420-0:L-glutamate ligase [Alphaproteobacteria bacterium]